MGCVCFRCFCPLPRHRAPAPPPPAPPSPPAPWRELLLSPERGWWTSSQLALAVGEDRAQYYMTQQPYTIKADGHRNESWHGINLHMQPKCILEGLRVQVISCQYCVPRHPLLLLRTTGLRRPHGNARCVGAACHLRLGSVQEVCSRCGAVRQGESQG